MGHQQKMFTSTSITDTKYHLLLKNSILDFSQSIFVKLLLIFMVAALVTNIPGGICSFKHLFEK